MKPYQTVAIVDSNVVLEGHPLADLPWQELCDGGNVLVVLLPQVLREVDSKKRDGRLAKHVRAFRKLFAPAAQSGQAHPLRRHPEPSVDVIIGRCKTIPWEQYDDLDPSEGDCKVVAEALHINHLPLVRPVFVSSDMYPIAMASRHGLATHLANDKWLRPPEPSPHQKEVQRLKERNRVLEAQEPQFDVELSVNGSAATRLYRVRPLSNDEHDKFVTSVLARNPMKPQSRRSIVDSLDIGYEKRYEEYESITVPKFADQLPNLLELIFGQFPFSVTVRNRGVLQAERVIVELHTSCGWLHDKFVYEAPSGPPPPRPRKTGEHYAQMPDFPTAGFAGNHSPHEVLLDPAPNRERSMIAHCEDFRHGRTWRFDGVLRIDPNERADPVVSVRLTAANMHGEIASSHTVSLSLIHI